MDNESIVINVPYLFQKNKEKRQEYKQRPEVKVRRREYDKKRYQLIKEKQREYSKLWYWRNKERQREYRKKCYQLNKELELKNSKLWYQRNKEKKQKQIELQSGYVFSSKQNFELSNFNCDDMCSEQIKNIAWDVLELQLYSETQETELDKLLEEAEFEYIANKEQSLGLSSENLLSNLIYDNVCGEQIVKDVSNNLELCQSGEQLLVNKKISQQNFNWNSNIILTSNLNSDNCDYNLATGFIFN
ncbi:hypothetical protein [Spiroplasma endosymbiont of Dasysyrphus albostriatus]|uniref:hypothetical protein n=1 Tax=Spiroplasma endosymbiont of Dasysyrphus albostriatus TaxID=3066299 RepID=UPI0030D041F7